MLQLIQFLVAAGTLAGYTVQGLSTFQWPNQLLDYADHQLYEGTMDGLVEGCTPRVNTPRDNTTISAQWLRLAYNDMSTHNVDDGTGGLDASIMYELDRAQNVGEGMVQSLQDFNGLAIIAPFFGMADSIALGAVFAVKGCGGPVIPYSAGRIDATAAGPPTVPQPQQNLTTHIELFRQQGFNETDMIALVACGHTLGGVRQVDFPLIVTDTSIDVDTFDTTPAFDNTIVSQYLQNTTQDVLVVGPNVTTQSDLRIFSSDGNVTMQSLLSADTFSDTCATLLQRMINTVPSAVNLTDPITEPFQYVINDPLFSYQNGTFNMITALRVRKTYLYSSQCECYSDLVMGRPAGGSFCPSTGCSKQSSSTQPVFFTVFGEAQGFTASRYLFNATINSTSSISKFWFEINNNDGSDPVVVDNGGSGFVIEQDPSLSLFVDAMRSELIFSENSGGFIAFLKVLGDAASASASMTAFSPFSTAISPPFTPTTTSINLELDETNPPEGGFTFFTANSSISGSFLDLTANVGSTSFTVENFNLAFAVSSFPSIVISS
ncbi:heme peroxidase [Gymnopus androsaceus JB14]|uniref:Peroxidase n=1 Tax=Gymnopus androsaceus JB14 TaxID=1447944 RepID=A0A6A4H7L2_9AGAR|nr:heme peroxidase [Gymnopus androsaceus JB14]